MAKIYDIYGNGVHIKTTIPAFNFLKLFIDIKENEHSKGVIEAEISEQDHQLALNSTFGGDKIIVLDMDNNLIFGGLIESVKFQIANRFMKVSIYCTSSTVLMDRDKKRRCFQNPKMTYSEVFNEIIGGYKNAVYHWESGQDRRIGFPLLQYDETDWEFAKRLSTHFHTVVYPGNDNADASFYIGCKKGKMMGQMNQEQSNILKYGISDNYYSEGGFEENRSRESSVYIEIVHNEVWNIGDMIEYQGIKYAIYRKQVIFNKGELVYKYLLGTNYFIHRKKIMNDSLTGVGLKGEVQKTEKENVYLKLAIEDKHAALYPWPWVPETGNMCYCMPETGTDVVLYFASGDERAGMVLHTLRKNQKSNNFSDVQNREIHTLHDKKIGLYQEKMIFEGKDKVALITLEDTNGIQLKSKNNINMNAAEGVYIKGKKGTVTAPLEIVCRTSQSNIEINRDFNFYAPGGVRTQGSGSTGESMPAAASREKKPEHWQITYSAMAAVPAVDFAKADDDGVIDLMAGAAVPKVAMGKTTVAMADVMSGKPESEVRYPNSLRSMEIYTVKGGYALPIKKR